MLWFWPSPFPCLAAALEVELVQDGQSEENGPVRVTVGGLQGRVCAANWTDAAAGVVCRQLGYAGGVAYQLSTFVSHLFPSL